MKIPSKGTIAGCVVIGAVGFLAGTQIAPAEKSSKGTTAPTVVCEETPIIKKRVNGQEIWTTSTFCVQE